MDFPSKFYRNPFTTVDNTTLFYPILFNLLKSTFLVLFYLLKKIFISFFTFVTIIYTIQFSTLQ